MLKPLIYLLVLVTLLAIGIKLGLFDKTIEEISIKSTLTSKSISSDREAKESLPKDSIKRRAKETIQESNLTNELTELLRVASIHFQKSEDSEAFNIYEKIIQKTQNSNDPKILKIFADTLFRRATLNYIYPNNDPEAAIEDYGRVIDKFKDSNNTELLKIYIEARLKQAKLQSKDELFNTFDELIKRFEKDKEHRFEKEVEELQVAQSFALMGDNAEEAMEVLDNIIAKYQARGDKKLPQAVEYSILNNIELSIITSNDDEKYVELANKYLSENEDTAPLLDMLSIIKNAQDLDQKEAIDRWLKEHKDYHFPDWDFSDLSEWADKMENPEGKKRIKEYLDIFLRQKYTRPSEDQAIYEEENSNLSIDNNTQNTEDETSEEIDDSIDNPEETVYINDTYETDNIYPNPYSNEEPQKYTDPYDDPNDGVSHTYNETYPY